MAQMRFNIGVPAAGSAARAAESERESFRSLRPAAGSAARQAEEERREAERSGLRRAGFTTIRIETPPHRNAEAVRATPISTDPVRSGVAQDALAPGVPASNQLSMQAEKIPASATAGTGSPSSVAPLLTSLQSNPLQTAAAKFKSLFRSVFPRAAGKNETIQP